MKKSFAILFVFLLISFTTWADQTARQDATTVIPKREKLLNGLPLVIAERPGSGSIALHLVIRSGSTFDLRNKAGLAELTSQMMLRAAGGWTAERLQEELADVSGKIEVFTGWDSTEVRIHGKSPAEISTLIDILSRVTVQTKFPEKELEQVVTERLKALENVPSATLADDALQKMLFGTHPYGHNITGTKETLSKISRFDLSDFYDRVYLANNASLVIAGDFSAEKILPVLKKAFGGWKKGVPPPYTFVPPKAVEGVSVKLLEKEQPTVDVRIGGFALKRTESDYVAAKVLINILNDRLSRNGGKFKATLTARKLPGSFTLSANLPTPNQTSQEIVAAIAELKRLTDINAGELQAAKERTLQEYSRILSTESKIEEAAKDSNILIADRLAEIENYDLGSSYAFTTLVNRVSLEEVKRVAEKYFSANNLIVVAVGSGLQESLKTVGSVELLDK